MQALHNVCARVGYQPLSIAGLEHLHLTNVIDYIAELFKKQFVFSRALILIIQTPSASSASSASASRQHHTATQTLITFRVELLLGMTPRDALTGAKGWLQAKTGRITSKNITTTTSDSRRALAWPIASLIQRLHNSISTSDAICNDFSIDSESDHLCNLYCYMFSAKTLRHLDIQRGPEGIYIHYTCFQVRICTGRSCSFCRFILQREDLEEYNRLPPVFPDHPTYICIRQKKQSLCIVYLDKLNFDKYPGFYIFIYNNIDLLLIYNLNNYKLTTSRRPSSQV